MNRGGVAKFRTESQKAIDRGVRKRELLVVPFYDPWVLRALLHVLELGPVTSENLGKRRVLCEIMGLGRIG